jgi:hypothetical protein
MQFLYLLCVCVCGGGVRETSKSNQNKGSKVLYTWRIRMWCVEVNVFPVHALKALQKYIAQLSLNLCTTWWWVVNFMLRPLYNRQTDPELIE